MKALVGLGNPGAEYVNTRHNVGFLALEHAAGNLGIAINKKQCGGLVGEGRVRGERVALFLPQTYMNLSGQGVLALMRWYKLDPEGIMIISDDIDLSPGAMRIRMQGGAGTHNGWRSIIDESGSEAFPRARIGVGAPPPEWDLKDWVLSRWDKSDEADSIREAIELAAKAGVSFLENDIQLTMNLFNFRSRVKKEKDLSGDNHAV